MKVIEKGHASEELDTPELVPHRNDWERVCSHDVKGGE